MKYVYPVDHVHPIHLADYDPDSHADLKHHDADDILADLGDQLTDLQETHYAAGAGGILIVLQGLDTAGKDGTITHVMTYFNPNGCSVHPFKVPTAEEQAHDFLWRAHLVTPGNGTIAIFNRSYYEDVLVTRVHHLVPEKVWRQHYDHINNFESLLLDSGVIILKFFLYVSKEEQRERLRAREEDREKAWKLSAHDWAEHELYGQYVEAYEDALSRCSTERAPWYIVPANHKWFRNIAVAQTIVDALGPHAKQWKQELEERGKEILQEIAQSRQAASPHTTS